MKTKEFKEELNKIAGEDFNLVTNCLPEEFLDKVNGFSTRIHLTDEKFKEFGLDFSDIYFIADFNPPNEVLMKPYFNHYEIQPDGYYVLPYNYVEVSLLDIISEAIKQNTNRPDIKHLQTPEGEEPIYETNNNLN